MNRKQASNKRRPGRFKSGVDSLIRGIAQEVLTEGLVKGVALVGSDA